MLSFGNNLSLGAVLDGRELLLESLSFKSLQLSSNKMFSQPMGNLQFADNIGILEDNPIMDNQSLTLYIGINKNPPKEYTFRVFKVEKRIQNKIPYYTLILVFNAPRWLYENTRSVIPKATSFEALKKLAEESKLSFVGDETVDRQNWYGVGNRRCIFAEYIAKYGYVNDTSCMAIGVSLEGEVRYKNISKLIYDGAPTFIDGLVVGENEFSVLDKKEFDNSGQSNSVGGGYKKITVNQDPIRQSSLDFTRFAGVSLSTPNKVLSINKNIVERIEGSVSVFSSIDCGNTHTNAVKACHQNSRIYNYYSSGMYCAIQTPTRFDLFDPINFVSFDSVGNKPRLSKKSTTSNLITGKTIFISQTGQYTEKFELKRIGSNGNAPKSQIT